MKKTVEKMNIDKELCLTPVSEKNRKKHSAEIIVMLPAKELSLDQRKKMASEPIYLIRYE